MAKRGNSAGRDLGRPGFSVALLFLVFGPLLLAGRSAAAPPVVDSLTASAAAVLPNGSATLTLLAHDPDCATPPCTNASACGQLIDATRTTFTPTGGTITSANTGTSASPYAATAVWQAPATLGSFDVTVSVSDNGGMLCGGRRSASATVTIQVSTTPNQAPVITSLSAGQPSLFPGQPTVVNAVASDPDGDAITFGWSTTAGTITPGTPGTAVFQAPSMPGAATVTCTVTDSKGASVSKTVAIGASEALAERFLVGLRAPQRLAINGSGEIFVVDPSLGGVAVMGLFSGKISTFWAFPGVRSVAIDWSDHLVFGGDAGTGIYDRSGALLQVLDPGATLGPVSDVAVDPAQQRFGVLFGEPGRIVVFGAAGGVLFAFGGNGDGTGQLRGATALSFLPTGDIAVSDTGHGLVQVFSGLDGLYVRSFGGFGSSAGQFSQASGVASRNAGTIYAVDSFHSNLQAFNPDGTLREVIGGYGDAVGLFRTPSGVAVSETFKRLVVASVNGSRLDVFRLSGSDALGPLLALSPTLLAFGSQVVGVASPGQQVTLTSAGTAPVDLGSVLASGDFLVTANNCLVSLAPGQSCGVTLVFRPTLLGPGSGALTIPSNAPGSPARVLLSGTGAAAPPPSFSLSRTLLDFGTLAVNLTSGVQTVTITNGSAFNPLALGALTLSGASPGDFAFSGDSCSNATLPPLQSCTFGVTFRPLSLGPRSAQVDLPGSPGIVQLQGAGAAAAAANEIPTLSEWGLVLLALALAGAGSRMLAGRLP